MMSRLDTLYGLGDKERLAQLLLRVDRGATLLSDCTSAFGPRADVLGQQNRGVLDYRTGLSRKQTSLWFAGSLKAEIGKIGTETAAQIRPFRMENT
jgi:hypothetical protein